MTLILTLCGLQKKHNKFKRVSSSTQYYCQSRKTNDANKSLKAKDKGNSAFY